MKMIALSLALSALLPGSAVASAGDSAIPSVEADGFFANIAALCGKAYEGRLVSGDAADGDMKDQRLVMHVRDCSADTIRIPFHVGEDRSRTWVVTRTDEGLRLKHDHRHPDGSEDALTQYGGDTVEAGAAHRQQFPADAFSRDLFVQGGIAQSAANVWAVEVVPGRAFAYELRRPNRFFRVLFDLGEPVAAPPPPWGAR